MGSGAAASFWRGCPVEVRRPGSEGRWGRALPCLHDAKPASGRRRNGRGAGTAEPSAEQREEQRRSFAYGNTAFENDRITRDMIDREAEKLASFYEQAGGKLQGSVPGEQG